jgi:hypothetical protein
LLSEYAATLLLNSKLAVTIMRMVFKISLVLAALSCVFAIYGAGFLYARHVDQQSLRVNVAPTDWAAEVDSARDLSVLRRTCSLLAVLNKNDRASLALQRGVLDRLVLRGGGFLVGWCLVTGIAASYIAYRVRAPSRKEEFNAR